MSDAVVVGLVVGALVAVDWSLLILGLPSLSPIWSSGAVKQSSVALWGESLEYADAAVIVNADDADRSNIVTPR